MTYRKFRAREMTSADLCPPPTWTVDPTAATGSASHAGISRFIPVGERDVDRSCWIPDQALTATSICARLPPIALSYKGAKPAEAQIERYRERRASGFNLWLILRHGLYRQPIAMSESPIVRHFVISSSGYRSSLCVMLVSKPTGAAQQRLPYILRAISMLEL